MVRDYYKAIEEKRFEDAYKYWERDGEASGKSFVAFLNIQAQVKEYRVTVGTPGPIEGAAGSRYITIPVEVLVRRSNGTEETQTGTYTLRLSTVDGATPEQRTWHLYTTTIGTPARADSIS